MKVYTLFSFAVYPPIWTSYGWHNAIITSQRNIARRKIQRDHQEDPNVTRLSAKRRRRNDLADDIRIANVAAMT
jgi:hypothetical protein